MDYKKIAVEILDKTMAKGADEAEVYVQLSEGTSIEIKDGEVDSFEGAKEHGIGFRTIIRQQDSDFHIQQILIRTH